MLHLRVFGAGPVMAEVATSVSALDGADHITWTDTGDRSGRALVTADVDSDAADAALRALNRLGVPADDVWLLRLEGRASAAVGVAISVTTIPASAYLGVAAGMGEVDKASGALAVLGINVAMLLLVGGSLTPVMQRGLARSAGGRDPTVAP